MKYLMFIKHAEAIEPTHPPKALMDAMGEFVGRMLANGVLKDTGGLKPTSEAYRIRSSGGTLQMTDGPFTETKEVIGGYALVETKSKEEADAVAREFMELHRVTGRNSSASRGSAGRGHVAFGWIVRDRDPVSVRPARQTTNAVVNSTHRRHFACILCMRQKHSESTGGPVDGHGRPSRPGSETFQTQPWHGVARFLEGRRLWRSVCEASGGHRVLCAGVISQRSYDAWRAGKLQLAKPPPAQPVWTPVQVDRSHVDYSRQPLWAWGVTQPPAPNDKQAVQFAPVTQPAGTPAPANTISPDELNRKRRVEGSQIEMSLAEVRRAQNGASGIVDWFPQDHMNPVPTIIRQGPAALGKDSRACGSCHLSDGSSRPENVAGGLPAASIVRQLTDFKNGLRHSADPRRKFNTMVMLSKAMTDDECGKQRPFSAVNWRPHVQVVETDRVPKTRIQGELFIPTAKELTEPIAGRLIEIPTDVEANQTLRNSRGTWIAYVPKGALEKGKDLVTAGGMTVVNGQIVPGKTTACGTCHGIDLLGVPPDVPPLAGRSPSYLAREIFDIQQGARSGSNSNVPLMKMVVANLQADDIVNITAYLASLPVSKSPEQVAER